MYVHMSMAHGLMMLHATVKVNTTTVENTNFFIMTQVYTVVPREYAQRGVGVLSRMTKFSLK